MITIEDAAADLKWMIEGDFSVSVRVTNPDGATATLRGQYNDIGKELDPELGAAVTGRSASIALSLSALRDEGLGDPRGVPETNRRPWIVEFTTAIGSERRFKVQSVEPDENGIIVCLLEKIA